MALASAIDVRTGLEPTPRGPLINPKTGTLVPGALGWFEGRSRQVGEIVSGVNRNAENIVQLEVDYASADGVVANAYIAADAVVAADATAARALLLTQAQTEFAAGDATLQTNIDTKASITYVDALESTINGSIASAESALKAEFRTVSNPSVASHPEAFTNGVGEPSMLASVVDSSGFTIEDTSNGKAIEFTSFKTVMPIAHTRLESGRTYRLKATAICSADATNGGGQAYGLRTRMADGDYAASSSQYGTTSTGTLSVSDGVLEREAEWTAPDPLASDQVFGRPEFYGNWGGGGTNGNSTVQLLELSIEDITDTEALGARVTTAEADIVAEQTARADGDSVSATDRALIRTEFASEDTATESAANTYTDAEVAAEASARSTAITAEAASRETLAARVESSEGVMLNGRFNTYTTTPGVPDDWVNWSGSTSNYTRVTGSVGAYAVQIVGNAGTNQGMFQTVTAEELPHLIEALTELNSGTYDGSGILLDYRSASSGLLRTTYNFADEADTAGDVSNSKTGVRRWRFSPVDAPSGTTHVRIYAMGHYIWHSGGYAVANNITFHECNARETNYAESAVNRVAEAYATDTSSTARLLFSVNTATNVGTIEASAAEGYDDGTWNGTKLKLDFDVIQIGTESSGERMTLTDQQLKIYDSSNTLRVFLGIE